MYTCRYIYTSYFIPNIIYIYMHNIIFTQCTYVCTQINIYIYIYTYTYTYTYTYKHIHTYIYIYGYQGKSAPLGKSSLGFNYAFFCLKGILFIFPSTQYILHYYIDTLSNANTHFKQPRSGLLLTRAAPCWSRRRTLLNMCIYI